MRTVLVLWLWSFEFMSVPWTYQTGYSNDGEGCLLGTMSSNELSCAGGTPFEQDVSSD